MPLENSSSTSAFQKNFLTELKTRPKKQALAIAYAVKRKAEKKKSSFRK